MPRPKDMEKRATIKWLYDEGLPIYDIADRIGRAHTSVISILKSMGLPFTDKARGVVNPKKEESNRRNSIVLKLWVEDKLSQKEIAERMGITKNTVAGILDRSGMRKLHPRRKAKTRPPEGAPNPLRAGRENGSALGGFISRARRLNAKKRERIYEPTMIGDLSAPIKAPGGGPKAAPPLIPRPKVDKAPAPPLKPVKAVFSPARILPFVETKENSCMWPLECCEDCEPGGIRCGGPRAPGTSYCATHNALSRDAVRPRKLRGKSIIYQPRVKEDW